MTHRMLSPLLATIAAASLTQSALSQSQAPPKNTPQQPGATPNAPPPHGQTTTNSGANTEIWQSQRDRDGAGAAPARSGASDFRSARWMNGRDVVGSTTDNVGEITDLVVDRGSGVLRSVAIKTGAVLGMGGRTVTVPYDRFRWDSGRGRLILDASAEDLARFPTFSSEEWRDGAQAEPRSGASDARPSDGRGAPAANQPGTEAREPGMNDTPPETARRQRDAQPGTMREHMERDTGGQYSENYGSQWDAGAKQRVEGEIRRIDRQYSPRFGDTVVVEVAAQDGSTKKVALGPSWYLSGGEAALNRGEKISIEYVPINVATAARVSGREINLRDQAGSGAWSGGSFQAGGKTYAAPYYRNVLLSRVVDARLDCRGADCGKVDDVIIDAASGVVAFLSIDPNQNFLGIADTKRLVPWQIASIAMDGTVRVDTSKDMVLASMKTPSDVTTLNTSPEVGNIYGAYQVQPRDLDGYRRSERDGMGGPGEGSGIDGGRGRGDGRPAAPQPPERRDPGMQPGTERRDGRTPPR